MKKHLILATTLIAFTGLIVLSAGSAHAAKKEQIANVNTTLADLQAAYNGENTVKDSEKKSNE